MSGVQTGTVTTKVPARLDRLPWSRRHWMVARHVRAQLIAVASRGGTATRLGSVSQHVLRRAPCPILVVPEAASHGSSRPRFGTPDAG